MKPGMMSEIALGRALWLLIKQRARCEHKARDLDGACTPCTQRDFDAAVALAERDLAKGAA